MKLTKMVAACAVAMACGAASAVTIDGIVLPGGLTFSTITLFEGEKLSAAGNNNRYIDTVGETLLGIGIVNQILDANNNIVWANGQNGRELTFVIDNFVADSFSLTPFPGGSVGQASFSGGTVRLYSQAAGTLNTGAATQAAALASAMAGNLFLDLIGSPDGEESAAGNGIARTLVSTQINTSGGNPFLASTNVTGQAFLDVVAGGGLAASYFDTNTYGSVAGLFAGDDADLKITSSGQLQAPGQGGEWGFRGTGEVEAFLVPTPGTLALAGLALVGVGALSQRRKVAAA